MRKEIVNKKGQEQKRLLTKKEEVIEGSTDLTSYDQWSCPLSTGSFPQSTIRG